MTIIRQEDFIQSVADALQFISCYHPVDYVRALGAAYEREESEEARDAMAQILVNSRMSAEGRRPMCQDTGIVVVYLRIGMDVRWEADLAVADMVNEGVRRAYSHPDNVLRASIVDPPFGARRNTGDNTPAPVHVELVPGDTVDVRGGGEGGRLGEQGPVRDAEPERQHRRLGAQDGARDGRRVVPAGHARDRDRRDRREGDGARQGGAPRSHRHARAARARAGRPDRGAPGRALREGQRARDRRPGPRRAHHRARREGEGVPHPRGGAAGRDDPQLRGHPAPALRARRERPPRSSSRRASRTGRT